MSATIRLSLVGKKKRPIYRIVVCEKRSKRDGRHIDILGSYNPNVNPPSLELNRQKLKEWVQKGAIVSDGLRKLLEKETKA